MHPRHRWKARLAIALGASTALAACGLGSHIDDYASATSSPTTGDTGGSGMGGASAGAGATSAAGGAHGGTGGSPTGGVAGAMSGAGTGGGTAAGGQSAAGGHAGATGGSSAVGGHAGATGGQAGTTGGAGAAGMGGTTSTGSPCSAEGTFSCAGSAQSTMLTCKSGHWIVDATCDNGQLCDGSAPPTSSARCKNPVPACIGHAPGSSVCDGVDRMVCGPDLVTATSTTCTSAALCMKGTGGACAICLPGDFQCTGTNLSKCSDDGSSYVLVKTCATAALCNVTVGDCSTAKCTAGQFRCSGDTLQTCDAQLDGFSDVMSCPAGRCDAANQHCDTCTPGQTSCKDGATKATCEADGVTVTPTACGSSAPHCIGNGQCVACASPSDCGPTGNECTQATCSNGTCGTTPVGSGAAVSGQTSGDCATVVCNGMGGTTTIANPGDLPGGDGNPCHSPSCGGDGHSPGQVNVPPGTGCGGSMVCNSSGGCCAPASCASTPGICNAAPDGCGGTYGPCTTCTAPSACDAASNSCVCTPLSDVDACNNAGYECGKAPNGCGGFIAGTCGTCPSGNKCLGGTCECTCFTAGARVAMADGSERAIETLREGDQILSFDVERGELVVEPVIKTFAHGEDANEDGLLLINGDVEATPNHPFYSAGRWLRADQLVVGAELLEVNLGAGAIPSAGRTGVVRSIEQRHGGKRTFNLEVRGTHTYFVNGVLVHNKLPC